MDSSFMSNQDLPDPEPLLAHTGWMKSLALSLVHDESLADDLVQETLLTAVERPPRHPEAMPSWLRKVLRNYAYRHREKEAHRRRREMLAALPEETSSTVGEVIERVELQHQMVDLVLKLDEPYRSSVLLSFFEDLSPKEIARRQGVDVSTVRWRLRSALRQLRARLDRVHGSRKTWCTVLLPALGLSAASRAGAAAAGSAVISAQSWGSFWILSGIAAMKLKSVILAVLLSVLVLALIVQVARPHLEDRTAKAGNVSSAGHGSAPTPSLPLIVDQPKEPAAEAVVKESAVPAPAPGPVIAGVVFEEETGAPIQGAVVRARGSEHVATTDPEGRYRLDGLAAGDHILVASGERHAEAHARVRLVDESDFHQDFALDPATELLLTVVDENGQPIEGVVVTRSQPAGDYDYSDEYSRRTGPDGRATLPGINRSKPQQLHAKKEGYRETWWKDYRFDPGRESAEGTLVLRKAPRLERVVEGRVFAKDGSPLQGMSVQWIHSWGPSKGREIVATDARGYYQLRFESEKETHPISVFGPGRAPLLRQDVRTGTPESPARVDFTLDDGHWLEGRVVDEDAKPIESVVLKVMPELGSLRNPNIQPGIVREATTDHAGLFSLEDLFGPTVAIRLVGSTGGQWANNVNEHVVVDTKVELTLQQWSQIRGRVTDKDSGEPVPAFRIQVEGGGKGYLEYARMNPGESFDAPDGRFVLQRLDDDNYDLTVHAEGHLSKRLEKVTAGPASRSGELEVRLTTGRPVEGVVIDADSGLALEKTTVIFGVWGSGELTWSSWSLEHMQNRKEAVTGADGAFRFLEDDPGAIFLRAPGHARLCILPGDRRRFADATGRLSVPLPRDAILSGAHYQEGQPCRTGFLIPVFLPDPSGSGEAASREWLESIDRDGEGRFRVEGLRPGSYWLDHYRETPGKVSAGMGTRRRLELEPGENVVEYGRDLGEIVFSGRLLDRDGKPLEGANMFLTPAFECHYVRFSARVDGEHKGRFWIGGLRPGKYGVEVEASGGKRLELPEIDLAESTERDLAVAALSSR